MTYNEVRMQREIHQLRREVREAKAREGQTRQGCLELVQALKELVTSLAPATTTGATRFTDLVDQVGAVFAPDVIEGGGPRLS